MEHLKAWITLLRIPGLGENLVSRLVQEVAPPHELLAHPELLDDISWVSQHIKEGLRNPAQPEDWPRIAKLIEKFSIQYITITDPAYPAQLKSIFDPPPILYYRGQWRDELFQRDFAVVGTRKASAYGIAQTRRLTLELARAGFTIVSGLAFGVDGTAHTAALDAGGKTLAVMGTGADQIYPSRHRELATGILDNGGLLISERCPGSRAERWHFPTRNRIISGLSLGTLVIEGSRKSGALLTSKFAMDQNRDVFALPGDVNRPEAEGPNYLIKLGAKIVTSAQDILEEYQMMLHSGGEQLPEMTPDEKKLYKLLLKHRPEIQFDLLLIESQLEMGELSTLLLMLELKGLIRKTAGNNIAPLF